MRNIVKSSLIAIVGIAVSLTPSIASAAYGRGFTVVNTNDDTSIQRVWFARAGEPNTAWSPVDMDSPIATNASSTFSISGSACFYDLRVQFSDGVMQTFASIDVCNGDRAIAN